MSYELTAVVWDYSKAKGSDKLVLLALAEWANGPPRKSRFYWRRIFKKTLA